MTGDPILQSDRVARYCSGTVFRGGDIQPTAFMVQVGNPELSVNWVEYYKPLGDAECIAEIRACLSAKMTLRSSGGIAVVNVGQVLQAIQGQHPDLTVSVEHDPEPNAHSSHDDPSHTIVRGLPTDAVRSNVIAELLVEQVQAVFPNG